MQGGTRVIMSVELSTAGRRRGRNRRPADRPWITLESQFMASTKWVPLHGAQYQPEFARQEEPEARPQGTVRSGHFQGAVQDDRARVRLGRQVPSPAVTFRANQSVALCVKDARLYDDQPAPLLPQLISRLRPLFHRRRIAP